MDGPGAIPPATGIRLSEYVSNYQPEVMIGNAAECFDAEGNLMDETPKKLIHQLLENLGQWARRLAQAT